MMKRLFFVLALCLSGTLQLWADYRYSDEYGQPIGENVTISPDKPYFKFTVNYNSDISTGAPYCINLYLEDEKGHPVLTIFSGTLDTTKGSGIQQSVEKNNPWTGSTHVRVTQRTSDKLTFDVYVYFKRLPKDGIWLELYSRSSTTKTEETIDVHVSLDVPPTIVSVPTTNTDAQYVGSQTVSINASKTIKYAQLIATESQTCLAESSFNGTTADLICDPVDVTTKAYTLTTFDEIKKKTPQETDTWTLQYVDSITLSPTHALASMQMYQEATLDSVKVRHPFNRIAWTVKDAKATDLWEGDMWVISRAKKPDFSDAEDIGYVDFTQYDSVSAQNMGYYHYDDKQPEALYNENSKNIYENKMYYRVYRAVLHSLWSQHRGKFCKEDSINLTNFLPAVTSVKVNKTDGFDEDKKVKVRIELSNPIGSESLLNRVEFSPITPKNMTFSYLYYSQRDNVSGLLHAPMDRYEIPVTVVKNTESYRWTVAVGREIIWTPTGLEDEPYTVNFGKFIQPDVSNDTTSMQLTFPTIYWYTSNGNIYGFGYHSKSYEDYLMINKYVNSTEINWQHNNFNAYYADHISKAYIAHKYDYCRRKVVDHQLGLNPNTFRMYNWDENAQIKVQRYSPKNEYCGEGGQLKDIAAKSYTIAGNEVMWDNEKGCYYVEMEDVQTAPFIHYYYKATVDNTESHWPILSHDTIASSEADANVCWSESYSTIASFKASEGNVEGGVQLTWEVGDPENGTVKLERKIAYTTNQTVTEWEDLKIDPKATEFFDERAKVGIVYEYLLTSTATYCGKKYSKTSSTIGWKMVYGSISGKLLMKNNGALCDSALVQLTVPEVRILEKKRGDRVLIPACYQKGETRNLPTNPLTGAFSVDSLLYQSEDTEYKINIVYGDASFVNPEGRTGECTIKMSDGTWNWGNMNFVCQDVKRISGRVLYEKSTIPAEGVMFKMNDRTLVDINGRPITTDNLGNFSFEVPIVQLKIQCFKEGHEFEDLGFIKDKTGNTVFKPTQDYDGLLLTDLTKVRLIGRISGSDNNRNVPHVQGNSVNIIGDNMHMELKLEGNDVAQIYYNNDDQSITKEERTFNIGKTTRSTKASFEKRRMMVYPDNQTAEFEVLVPPTRYKLTALSAEGYSTLLNTAQGLPVLDLTAVTDSFIYEHAYHGAVGIDCEQLKAGTLYNKFVGDEKVKCDDMMGTTNEFVMASYDKEKNQANYTFGYPVFTAGKSYQLRATAYEKFFYNNDSITNRAVKVPFRSGELIVRNALKDGCDEVHAKLDSLGHANFTIEAQNTTFTLVGKEALRNVDMQVKLNGYYYAAAPLRGFVMGSRRLDSDLLTIGEKINVLDILRDPPGSGSFATREAGTSYKWDYTSNSATKGQINVKIAGGPAVWVNAGAGVTITSKVSVLFPVSFNITFPSKISVTDKEYTMTLSEKVSTSADVADQGAMADVYIGKTTDYVVATNEAYAVVNDSVYKMYESAIKSGVVKDVAQGETASGKFHMLIGEKYEIGSGQTTTFAYSQKHIMGNVIPNLKAKRDALIRDVDTKDEAAWQKAADAAKKPLYFRCKNDTTKKVYFVTPQSMKSAADYVSQCNSSISQWEKIIENNEKAKVNAIKGTPSKAYSLGQTAISYSEAASKYDVSYDYLQEMNGGLSFGGGINKGMEMKDSSYTKVLWKLGNWNFEFSLSGGFQTENSVSKKYIETYSRGYGYTLVQGQQGYMDIDVYDQISDAITTPLSDDEEVKDGEYNNGHARLHSHIFKVRGGATRSPWFDADTTFYYNHGTKLGARTLKIDNPTIYVDQPVVSNLPGDEKAYFSVRLANETELDRDVSMYFPYNFTLFVNQQTNPNGARLYIDGQPFTGGLEFSLKPGESVTKTLEVERGAGYDYNNIQLKFRDDTKTLFASQNISVHYLPTSTPLNIVTPTDKWTMNTLSDQDSKGYFIPVEIGGFNVNYDNFDHIELQYKKHTEGESQWVNLCSYYVNDSLYHLASGKKEKIKSGKISNIRFYGGQKEEEMVYDLRAVSFCRLGTGYVTRSSNVMTGTKDTRLPAVFGLPQPASGIWRYDDVISLNFSENIAYNYLDKTSNFSVNGFTNNTEQDYSSWLSLDGTSVEKGTTKTNKWLAATKVTRNLSNTSFTFDAMVKVDSTSILPTFFSQNVTTENVDRALVFGFMRGIQGTENLYAYIDDEFIISKPIDTRLINIHASLTHVGMVYNDKDSTVNFFVGDNFIGVDPASAQKKIVCRSNDILTIGVGKDKFCMANARLWNKVLTASEVAYWRNKRLNGNESGLLAYWPMDETQGSVAKDLANGADLQLQAASWQTMEGHALHLNNKAIALKNANKISASENDDYTLAFWYHIESLKEDSVELFRAGHPNLSDSTGNKFVVYAQDNCLKLKSKGNEIVLSEDTSLVKDKQWHHLTLAVSHTQNSVAAYIDGKMIYTNSATEVGGVSNDLVRLGSDKFTGSFDKLTFWHLALHSEYIKSFYNHMLKGNEMELAVYLPFNKYVRNSQNTIVSKFSGYNQAYDVVAKEALENETTLMIDTDTLATTNHAPLRTANNLQNFDFSWTATNNALQININKQDEEINQQKINITVRGVEDLNGNSMAQPQMWTIYAYRNRMDWTEKEVEMNLHYGDGGSLQASWENMSGNELNYQLTTDRSWLTLSKNMGYTAPLSKDKVTLKVDEGMAPGTYEANVSLKDENRLVSTMKVKVTITATAPEWNIVKNPKFGNTMVVNGRVKVRNYDGKEYVDMDERDIVGVFYNTFCVGKGNVKVNSANNTSNVFLSIIGTDDMNKSTRPLEFRLWRASTGEEVKIQADSLIYFRTNASVGCNPMSEPLELTQMKTRVQRVELTSGWNWVSLNVTPDVKQGVNGLFMSNRYFLNEDRVKLQRGGFAIYDQKKNKWVEDAEQMPIQRSNVYQIYVQKDAEFSVMGAELEDSARYVKFEADSWNELPYLLNVAQPINIALSGYIIGDKAAIGTIIKDHDNFAIATKSGWVGSLEYLTPGRGYYVKHSGKACTIAFTNNIIDYVPGRSNVSLHTQYNSMMPVIASLGDSIQAVEGDELVAYVGNIEVGRAAVQQLNNAQRFLLAVNANEHDNITFALERHGEVVAKSCNKLSYGSELVAGSIEQPYTINFEGVQAGDGHYYTVDGKYLGTKAQKGINISKNAKFIK